MQERGEGIPGVQEEAGEINEAIETEQQPETEIIDGIEVDGTEDVRALAEKAYAAEKAKADATNGGDGEADGEAAQKTGASKPSDNQQANDGQSAELAPPVIPPNRLSLGEKELFNKLPRKFKPAVARMFAHHEAAFTQAQTEWNREINEVRHLKEAVRPYYVSHPELAEAGYTEGSFIAALVARHSKLSDPKTSYSDYIRLGKELGHLGEDGALKSNENAPRNVAEMDISNHPQFLALQQSVNQLSGTYRQAEEMANQQIAGEIVTEWESLREEKDQFGRYKYPELHNPEFLEATKPLVLALGATLHGQQMSHAERLLSAWATLTGNSPSQNPTRLPAQNRAVTAGVSVRGRSAVTQSADSGLSDDEIAKMSIRELAEYAERQGSRGV